MKWLTVLFAGAFIASLTKAGFMVADYIAQRGIRNNNPGNIRHGDNWQGMADVQTDASFIQFVNPEYGIRAMTKILLTYNDRYGLNTVRGIISRWAPPVENDTESYINSVASRLDVYPDDVINVRAYMPDLVEAIIYHENGIQPYEYATLSQGIILAGVSVSGGGVV